MSVTMDVDKMCETIAEATAELARLQKYRDLAREMRNAIDRMELAMMGVPEITDLPEKWGAPRMRDDVTVTITLTAEQVYDVCQATARLNHIVNSDKYLIE